MFINAAIDALLGGLAITFQIKVEYPIAREIKSSVEDFITITIQDYPRILASVNDTKSNHDRSDHLSGSGPSRAHEPDIPVLEDITSKALNIPCSISPFTQGDFNKLYNVRVKEDGQTKDARQMQHLLRVSLSINPKFKTLSEVTTLTWIRQHTSVPVPKILAYDCSGSSHNDKAGFEWMLMEKIPGKPLDEIWTSMTWAHKEELVIQLARCCADLFSKRLSAIGNLFFASQYGTAHKNH